MFVRVDVVFFEKNAILTSKGQIIVTCLHNGRVRRRVFAFESGTSLTFRHWCSNRIFLKIDKVLTDANISKLKPRPRALFHILVDGLSMCLTSTAGKVFTPNDPFGKVWVGRGQYINDTDAFFVFQIPDENKVWKKQIWKVFS